MKKIILYTLFIVTLTASCKKERTCKCVINSSTVKTEDTGKIFVSSTANGYSSVTNKQRKKKFRIENKCYSTTAKTSDSGSSWTSVTTTEKTCTIK